jgi:tetraacyldisaccharide 4'-kinase
MKWIRYLLFPFAILYGLITSIRNLFFNTGVFTSTSFEIPTIVVGNLSVGGTGKTPQIEYLIRLLKTKNNVAVLSRGYKRKTTGFVLVNNTHSAEDVGDEPLQFFKKYEDISVAVDANRVAGIQQLQKVTNTDLILLDDAYQHRKVKARFYVLLTKFDELYTNDFIVPMGNLREARIGAKRAHAIVVTKCPKELSKNAQDRIVKKIKPAIHQTVFFSTISYADHLKGALSIATDALNEYTVLLVTGIAKPAPMLDFLKEKKVVYKHLKFPDHHAFSTADVSKIHAEFNKISTSKKLILTTEKDYVRLSDKIISLSYLEIETQFLDKEHEFNHLILEATNSL